MTFEDEVEVRHASVGTKVLAFGFAIFAVLGSFWGVVWFIRSYVEQPRVNIAPSSAFAAQENPPAAPAMTAPAMTPVANPPAVITAPAATADTPPAAPPPPAVIAEATPRNTPAAQPAAPPSSTGSVSDRWAPIGPGSAPPSSAAGPKVVAAPAALTSPPATPASATSSSAVTNDPTEDQIAESSVPAISGPAPLPRRKPTQLAAIRRGEPPLPRPRPESSEPQSIWQAVPSTDDRYQSTQ